ncbi:MAG: DUF3303 family protein [Acidobacteria bacterium]|nr:DUF3303 family protein [Acidobacteriota bacterium]
MSGSVCRSHSQHRQRRVHRRFRDGGRMAPEGLTYVSSWVDEKIKRCFQLMETDDRCLLDE